VNVGTVKLTRGNMSTVVFTTLLSAKSGSNMSVNLVISSTTDRVLLTLYTYVYTDSIKMCGPKQKE